MWAVLEICLLAALVLIFFTEFFIPMLFNKPLFGSFRKVKPTAHQKSAAGDSLPDKIQRAKEKVEEVKDEVEEVQDQAYKNYKSAEELKEESDKLL